MSCDPSLSLHSLRAVNAFTMFIFAYFIVTEYYNDMKRKLGVHTIPGDLPPEQHRREVRAPVLCTHGMGS